MMDSGTTVVAKCEQRTLRGYSPDFGRNIAGMHRWLGLLAALPVASFAAVVSVNEPWVRPATAGASTDVFMELLVSEDATLTDVRTPVAARVSLAQGAQRRAPPFALRLAAQQTLLMRDRGTRIVLARIDRTLKLGDRVALTLVLRYADGSTQDIEVDAEVRRRSPSEDHGHAGHRH
jgi:copper(I)-binding protein